MPNFRSIDVPAGGNYTYVEVTGVDNAGEAVGTYGSSDGEGDSTFYGFYTNNNSATGLPFNWSNVSNTDVNGITPDGVIYGDYTDLANHTHGFTSQNGPTSNFDILLSSSTSIAGMNDSGVSWGSYVSEFGNEASGFVDNNGTISFINAPGAIGSSVSGVNASGTIVGGYTDASYVEHAFVDVNGNFTTIDVPGGFDVGIVGINDAGVIVGDYVDGSQTTHGFVDDNGVITTLRLPGNVGITGINDAGEIVGYYTDAAGNVHGFTDINGTLATADVPGATESDIVGVTASGELYGFYDDAGYVQHGFVGDLPSTAIIYPSGLPPAPPQAAPYDLYGDGYSGVLWRSNAGGVAEWNMQGGEIESSAYLTSGGTVVDPGSSWSVAGVADFNGDGRSDLLWRNSDGELVTWLMNGSTIEASAGISTAPDASWSVVGTGDFNDDGKADMLWRSTSGELVEWNMNGSAIIGSGDVTAGGTAVHPDASWSVAGVGDFDGNGASDILWRNTNGSVAVWSMNGSQIVASGGEMGPDASWSVAGVGDFDGDGRSDVLWRGAGGGLAVWLMDGANVVSSAYVTSNGQTVAPDASWHVVEVGDFNGDGKADILWRNDNGTLAEWMMNGSQIASSFAPTSQGVAIQPDASWSPKV